MNRLIIFIFLTIPFAGIAQIDSADIHVQDTTAKVNALQFGIEFGPTYGLIKINENNGFDWPAYGTNLGANNGDLTINTQSVRGIHVGIFVRKPFKQQFGFTPQFNLATYKSFIDSKFDSSAYASETLPIQSSVGFACQLDYQFKKTPIGLKFGPHLFYVFKREVSSLGGAIVTERKSTFKEIQLQLDFSIFGAAKIKNVRTTLELKYALGATDILQQTPSNVFALSANSIYYHSISLLIGLAN